VRLLLHICCAPCAIYPVTSLRDDGVEVMGFFYRHNIHPFSECLKREETLKAYSEGIDLRVIYQEGYELERFLQNVVFREAERCDFCYHDRLRTTALMARRGRFDGFSSTLLYSKFQNHARIAATGEAVGKTVGGPFVYRDFRPGWKAGIEASKKLGLYRQQYCGCIYSEKERFYHPPKS
jgi:predicted adenine nucleotide alpha hydrolase (AANH) superfamily ATPase